MMPGESVHELAPLYALDALDTHEKEAFEEHLRTGCEACARDLRSFEAVATAIGESVAAPPPAELRQKLMARISGKPGIPGILLGQSGVLISRSHELAWKPMAEGIAYKPLFEDGVRRYNTCLVRMEAGARYPSHRHQEIEELFMLSGELNVENQVMRTGDYCRADSGTIHGETFTETGCLFLLLASQDNQVVQQHSAH
jgi:quercetin dioxygenase-like cupin family protein